MRADVGKRTALKRVADLRIWGAPTELARLFGEDRAEQNWEVTFLVVRKESGQDVNLTARPRSDSKGARLLGLPRRHSPKFHRGLLHHGFSPSRIAHTRETPPLFP